MRIVKSFSEREARDKIARAQMRRGLLEFLWIKYYPHSENAPSRPMPAMTDVEIKRALKKILFD